MNLYDTLLKMNTTFGIWHYTERLRVTYVCQGWLVVWDHQDSPPTRYDCRGSNHMGACKTAADKLRELSLS